MVQTKNLCAQIPTALHAQVCEAREQSGLRYSVMEAEWYLSAEVLFLLHTSILLSADCNASIAERH